MNREDFSMLKDNNLIYFDAGNILLNKTKKCGSASHGCLGGDGFDGGQDVLHFKFSICRATCA